MNSFSRSLLSPHICSQRSKLTCIHFWTVYWQISNYFRESNSSVYGSEGLSANPYYKKETGAQERREDVSYKKWEWEKLLGLQISHLGPRSPSILAQWLPRKPPRADCTDAVFLGFSPPSDPSPLVSPCQWVTDSVDARENMSGNAEEPNVALFSCIKVLKECKTIFVTWVCFLILKYYMFIFWKFWKIQKG